MLVGRVMSKHFCRAVFYESVHFDRQRQALVKIGLGSPAGKQITDGLLKTKPLKPKVSG